MILTVEQTRHAFAEEIRAVAHLENDPLIRAYASVPREAFLGPGPWQIARPFDTANPYRTTPDGDPRHIYHDVVVAIDPVRQLNNGQPSALAKWIDAMDLAAGQRAMHVGCGVGYYTAIIAEVVGTGGHVDACDVDPDLAARATANLASRPQVTVFHGDASTLPGTYDGMFINAGATHARPEWLAALVPGGRLVVPLTMQLPNSEHAGGVVVRVVRTEGERWPLKIVSQVGIFPCTGARDPANEAELRNLWRGGFKALRWLETRPHERGEACMAHIPGFCLQRDVG